MKISKHCFLIEKKKAPLSRKRLLITAFFGVFLLSLIFFNDIQGALANGKNPWLDKAEKGGLSEIGSAFGYAANQTPLDPRVIVARSIKIFLGFLGIVFLALIVFAGFKWMMAGDNSDEIKKARAQILNGVIGLLIITAAYVIADYVVDCVVGINTGDSLWMCNRDLNERY